MKSHPFFIWIILFFILPQSQAQLQTDGPYQVATGEYRFAATVDAGVVLEVR
ncbi:MAG: hypothetical protein H7Z71_03725 [Moraxellaceae bacterium]|nr:hypothetical protein [Pseudobdellovibrionaceae bacterium]